MKRSASILAILLWIFSTTTYAQPTDPYADQQKGLTSEDYVKRRDVLLSHTRYLYFAVGCQVFGSEAGILPLLSIERSAIQRPGVPVVDTKLDAMIAGAARQGLAQASQQGACAYWKDHPRAVYLVRQRASAAIEMRYPQ